MLHLSLKVSKPYSSNVRPRFNLQSPKNTLFVRLPVSYSQPLNKFTSLANKNPLGHIPRCTSRDPATQDYAPQDAHRGGAKKSFWGAVSLIIGTAVGPGMLGLPAATIKSGSLPSTITIVLCWIYVISSIVLVAELSFSAMQQDGVEEVSFTVLATKTLGGRFGALVAVVYASLSFSLLVACVSGIGSIVSQWLPRTNIVLAHALFPLSVGFLIAFFPFKIIDNVNRFLCLLMLFSITALVATGLSVARRNVSGSFAISSWSMSSILPAVPVTVLTLGFHVITPFICKLAGNSVSDARKAILIGGTVPLIMVLSWNLIVLGLADDNGSVSTDDPISLLLSVNPSALSAVQGFAFSALATSLIGYAVSFPKQLLDTFELISGKANPVQPHSCLPNGSSSSCQTEGVGFVSFSSGHSPGNARTVTFQGFRSYASSEAKQLSSTNEFDSLQQKLVMMLVLSIPIIIGSFFPSTFPKALNFAGVYANCFLFGILPPLMAYVQHCRKKIRSAVLPGGDITLLLLFTIAVILGSWH